MRLGYQGLLAALAPLAILLGPLRGRIVRRWRWARSSKAQANRSGGRASSLVGVTEVLYQTMQRFSSGRTIASPALHWKAVANSGMLVNGALARKRSSG